MKVLVLTDEAYAKLVEVVETATATALRTGFKTQATAAALAIAIPDRTDDDQHRITRLVAALEGGKRVYFDVDMHEVATRETKTNPFMRGREPFLCPEEARYRQSGIRLVSRNPTKLTRDGVGSATGKTMEWLAHLFKHPEEWKIDDQ